MAISRATSALDALELDDCVLEWSDPVTVHCFLAGR